MVKHSLPKGVNSSNLFNVHKEIVFCYNMDETRKHCAEKNKPERNNTLFHPRQSYSETGSKLQATQSRKERIVTAYILQDLKRNYEDNGDGDYIII